MNPINKNSNNENNDKTIVFNSLKDFEKKDTDKTELNQNNTISNQLINEEKVMITSNSDLYGSKEKEINDELIVKSNQKSENKSILKDGIISGVVGLGGLVAGTVYSEEIKGALDNISTDFFGNNDQIPELTENANQNAASLTFSDSTGLYEVTLTDSIGDGNIDSLNIEAQLVDGTNVQFTASDSFLDQLFNNQNIEVASANDYLSNMSGVFEAFTPESINSIGYQIQQGDTLSEIAATHNTTIEQLMELNPNITDPNLIFAGNELNIPSNDNFITPPDELNPLLNDSSNVFIAQNETNFDSVDWSSFEDQPLDDYSEFLQSENFDDYSLSDSYLAQNNDLSSLDFFQ
jgi:LysM repeat protein